jgi:hypothetical protein
MNDPELGQLSPFYRKNPEKIKSTAMPSGSSVQIEIGRRLQQRLRLTGGREEAPAGRSKVAGLKL